MDNNLLSQNNHVYNGLDCPQCGPFIRAQQAAQQPCPSCGYCSTCGRPRNGWNGYYYWQQPIYTWTSTGTGIQSTQAPNS